MSHGEIDMLNRLFAYSLAAALALAPAVAHAQAANPAPTTYAYGPAGQPISPISGGLLGAYSKSMVSGTIAAGLAAESPVYSFRYGGTGIAVIRKVTVSAIVAGTAFTVGAANLELFAARSFTASDSGGTAGTLTGNNSKLRTSLATTAVSDIRIASTGTLTAGTRTLDTDQAATVAFSAPATLTFTNLLNSTELYKPGQAGDYPMELATNEGFVIQATVPATGTWTLQVLVDWEEYSAFGRSPPWPVPAAAFITAECRHIRAPLRAARQGRSRKRKNAVHRAARVMATAGGDYRKPART